MKKIVASARKSLDNLWDMLGSDMRSKLLVLFTAVKVIPLVFLAVIAWQECVKLGKDLSRIAVSDSSAALNDSAIENIERMTTDTAQRVADFLYGRDADILYVAMLRPTEEDYRQFVEAKTGRLMKKDEWLLAPDGKSWISQNNYESEREGEISTNSENNDMDGFNYRGPERFIYEDIPLYDEITFIDLYGNELVKVSASGSTKVNYPLSRIKRDVSRRENTYVKAETYFAELRDLKPGEIYVSDVIGAYIGTNYIGMYTPQVLQNGVPAAHPNVDLLNEIGKLPQKEFLKEAASQAYAGRENPNGQRFEGIVRWATPVTDERGAIIGYVTLALNHDHIMEFLDHQTPMGERYTELPSAFEGNYAFIWDYKCRNICHPRHHSIVGFDPATGEPQIPWLESSIYDAWLESGIAKWNDFILGWPVFDAQSRTKTPAPELTKAGLVGLDGRYLNNAPQCTGWMDLSQDGGSGSFYILWSGLYKLTTAAAIPYYTGHYGPSENNDYSLRGFGVVTIGAGLEDFTEPSRLIGQRLTATINKSIVITVIQLAATTIILIGFVMFIAVWLSNFLTNNIRSLINGISRFKAGERQFRFNSSGNDEFSTLANSFDDMADNIVYSVNSPLCIIDMDYRIIYMNDRGLELRGMSTLEEVLGTAYTESSVYPPGSKYCPLKALQDEHETEPYYLEDHGIYMKGVANYIWDKDGDKVGYIIVSTDVTEIVRVQLELEQAVEAAVRANEHKGEFLARMSHEIRTPMNAIIGMTGIVLRKLEEENVDYANIAEIKSHVKQIEVSSQHLLGLLNDILDISKIEAGKIELSEEVVDLPRLVNTVVSIIKPRCDEKNIAFGAILTEFYPSTFLTDPLRLRQVLINLLGNAVKFTPEYGRVEFRVEKKEQSEGRALIKFSVSDTGIGISDEAQSTIFQSFEQAGNTISRKYGGTGLGLAISNRIVQLFGGDISVTSKLGMGSEFSFSIWLKETESDLSDQEGISDPTGKFAGKRALVVDDVEINRMIVLSMLETTGMIIDEAEDGKVALEKFSRSPEGSIDIVFMDVQMPHMNGYEAAMAIRDLNRSDAYNVPIVALTANAFKEDVDTALRHGMNAHLAKPVEIDKLVEILFKFLP